MSHWWNNGAKNAYYQYFCGMQEFTPYAPCASSELVHFRQRIGEKGVELIFQESIRVNNENDDDHHHDTAFIDSTVRGKRISLTPQMQSCIKKDCEESSWPREKTGASSASKLHLCAEANLS